MGRHANPSPQLRRSKTGAWRVWARDRWHHIAAADAPATEVQRRYRILLQRLESNPRHGRKVNSELSLAELVEMFLLDSEAPRSSTARFTYVQTLDLLGEAFPRALAVREYDGDRQREFRGWLVAQRIGERQRWNVSSCNKFLGAVRRLLKFAESKGLADLKYVSQVRAVQGVRRGDTRAPRLVTACSEADLQLAIPKLRGPLAAMVQLQWLLGMRSGEICRLRPLDVHLAGPVDFQDGSRWDRPGFWLIVYHEHKTDASGDPARWQVGPQAQAVLAPFLDRPPVSFCFSPRETVEALRVAQRATRKGQGSRKRVVGRTFAECYDSGTYRQALRRACIAAGVPPINPHRIRHAFAQRTTAAHGLDAARSALNHKGPMTTARYAQKDLDLAAVVAAEN